MTAARRRSFANPAWTNHALARVWPVLRKRVKPKCLPTLRRGDAQHLAKLAAVEYGSGAYGTVLPSGASGWVVKVTSDPTEAAFALAARRLRPYPPGIVRYGHVFRVPGTHDGRPIYVLWREEAFDVGTALDPQRPDELAVLQVLLAIQRDSDGAFRRMHDPASRRRNLPGILQGMRDARRGLVWSAGVRLLGGPARRAGVGLARAQEQARALARSGGRGASIGAAFTSLMKRGIMLADVHPGNVGRVRRGGRLVLAITDPGHAIFLDPRAVPGEPPAIGVARGAVRGRPATSGVRRRTRL